METANFCTNQSRIKQSPSFELKNYESRLLLLQLWLLIEYRIRGYCERFSHILIKWFSYSSLIQPFYPIPPSLTLEKLYQQNKFWTKKFFVFYKYHWKLFCILRGQPVQHCYPRRVMGEEHDVLREHRQGCGQQERGWCQDCGAGLEECKDCLGHKGFGFLPTFFN